MSKKEVENALFELFDAGDYTKVEYFIELFGVDATDRDGRNILVNLIIEGHIEWAIRLIAREDINVNQSDKNGHTALHFAVQAENFSLIKALVEKSANINAMDANGNTPLADAIFEELDKEVIAYLINNGGNLMQENQYGVKPIDYITPEINQIIESKK